MIYFTAGDLHVVVLESENLEKIRQGKPAYTQDKKVLIAFTPDPVWLADKLMDNKDGDLQVAMRLIDEAAKRPQKPPRPHHPPVEWKPE